MTSLKFTQIMVNSYVFPCFPIIANTPRLSKICITIRRSRKIWRVAIVSVSLEHAPRLSVDQRNWDHSVHFCLVVNLLAVPILRCRVETVKAVPQGPKDASQDIADISTNGRVEGILDSSQDLPKSSLQLPVGNETTLLQRKWVAQVSGGQIRLVDPHSPYLMFSSHP